jgi:3-oxoacid CoA-transferase B subunit
MNLPNGWSKYEQAERVIKYLRPHSYVNLGVGMPGIIAEILDDTKNINFHCENGLVGYRGLNEGEVIDPDIIDAATKPVGLITGAAIVAHDLSFAIARGGRLDTAVLGAFQVSESGDLANWKSPNALIAGVGGAMDLAVGAKQVIVMMKHLDKNGESKIVKECTYPITARKVVDYIVTEFAVFGINPTGLVAIEIADGMTEEMLETITNAAFISNQIKAEV